MKIFIDDDKHYYFLSSANNGLWHFSLKLPDINTLVLSEIYVSNLKDTEVWEKAIEVPSDLGKLFDKNYDKPNNYEIISKIIKDVTGHSQEQIDNIFDRDIELVECVKNALKVSNSTIYIFPFIFYKAKSYHKKWNDYDRLYKFLIEYIIPKYYHSDIKMIDIYSKCSPVKRKLIRMTNANENYDKYIDEASEIFTEDDIDKAYYYIKEKLLSESTSQSK